MKKLIILSIIFLMAQNAYAQSVPYEKDNYSVVPAVLPKEANIQTSEELPALAPENLQTTDTTGEHIAKQTGYYAYVAGRWVVQTTYRGIKKSSPYIWDGTTWTLGTLKKGFITGFNMVSPVPLPI